MSSLLLIWIRALRQGWMHRYGMIALYHLSCLMLLLVIVYSGTLGVAGCVVVMMNVVSPYVEVLGLAHSRVKCI